MVSIDKIQRGLNRFVDAELSPKVDGKNGWLVCGFAKMYISNLPNIVRDLKEQKGVYYMGAINGNNEVDIDRLVSCFTPKSGVIEIPIPICGDLKFDADGINQIKTYIMQS